MQVLWIVAYLLLPRRGLRLAFLVLVAGELAVPIVATRDLPTRWHAEHIAERYGLLTIIVLGESVLAGATAFSSVADDAFSDFELLFLAVGALLLVFAMWWLYFERSSDDLLTPRRAPSSGATATTSSGPRPPRSAPASRSAWTC